MAWNAPAVNEQDLANDRALAEVCQNRCRSEFMGDRTWGLIPDDQRLAFKACADQCIGAGRARADAEAEAKAPAWLRRLAGLEKRKG